ncbi:MAG: response regulator, partial [Oleispira sp.]|nr:response regulator [Oleispira sp.]
LSKLWKKSLDNMFILKVIDNHFYVVSTNDAQQESVNIEDLEHCDKPLREVLPSDLYNFVVPNYLRCIQAQTAIQYEESETITSGDGSIRHWSTMLSPINDDGGNIDYIFGISRNITELKNAKQAAEESAQQAEKANQVKTTFLANMSHEMRTPLNGIQCAIQLLKETQNEQEKSELIGIIESSTEALSRQTLDILQYAKIGKGKIVLQEANYSPLKLIQSVVKIIANSAELKSLALNISISEQVPHLVKGDPDRIKQVLLNIANNAIKFTNEGSVSISLEHDSKKELLTFCVIDTGIGIRKSDQEKLFKPFSQVDDSTTRQFEGNGLGLVISKELVHLMQGEIHLTSNLGQGTECKFIIPYLIPAEKENLESNCSPNSLSGVNILIVEDNSTNQIVLNKILTNTGASITLANNGKQALDLCRNNLFDIILMDWHMPVLDGLATTQTLRENPVFADTPILGLTASVMEEDIKACIKAGMNEVITKPINREELFNVIAKYSKQLSSRNDHPSLSSSASRIHDEQLIKVY